MTMSGSMKNQMVARTAKGMWKRIFISFEYPWSTSPDRRARSSSSGPVRVAIASLGKYLLQATRANPSRGSLSDAVCSLNVLVDAEQEVHPNQTCSPNVYAI